MSLSLNPSVTQRFCPETIHVSPLVSHRIALTCDALLIDFRSTSTPKHPDFPMSHSMHRFTLFFELLAFGHRDLTEATGIRLGTGR